MQIRFFVEAGEAILVVQDGYGFVVYLAACREDSEMYRAWNMYVPDKE